MLYAKKSNKKTYQNYIIPLFKNVTPIKNI